MNNDCQEISVHWINLDRDIKRRKRMLSALDAGGWHSKRWRATDGSDHSQKFISFERFWQKPSQFPGSFRHKEADPRRHTTRSELACLCSWQKLIESLQHKDSSNDWFLLMEDDVGSSLAVAPYWPFSLGDLINQAGENGLAIQMAPINGKTRLDLFQEWLISGKQKLLMPKSQVRSHGNGAILLNKKAIPLLRRRIGRWIETFLPSTHLLGHPRQVRPVADKWLYASLPVEKCWVLTFPLFILEAETSSLHQSHVSSFHNASRKITQVIWHAYKYKELIQADKKWKSIIS